MTSHGWVLGHVCSRGCVQQGIVHPALVETGMQLQWSAMWGWEAKRGLRRAGAWLQGYKLCAAAHDPCCPATAQVHSGFLTAYDSLRPALLGLLAALLEGEQGHWTLQMTGHSLGGALATLAAWDCAHRR